MAGQLTYRVNLLIELQDRMHGALEKVRGAAEKFEEKLERTRRAAQTLDRQRITPTIEGRDKLSEKLTNVSRSLQKLTAKAWTVTLQAKDQVSGAVSKVGNAMTTPLGMIGMGVATMGVGALATDGMNKAMDFEAQLSSIRALTGATSEEMERMRVLSLKLGADTKYSALEAAQGFEELLKAGMSVSQVEGGGAEAALNLATAGGLGLAEAAEIMSTALNAFKADGMSAAQAANILAGTANASATGVQELKFSLAAVSAVASGVGMSFQDVNTALGLFANNGLKGSDAGTSLKSLLMNLIPITKAQITQFEQLGLMTEQGTSAFFNQEGRLRSLNEISGMLKKSMAGLNEEQRLSAMQTMFGSDAIRASNILFKEGTEGVAKFVSEMSKVTALDVAKEKMNNAKGAVEQLKGAFETLQIRAFEPLLPIVTKVANGLGDTFDGMTDRVVGATTSMAANILSFMDELAGDEQFQAMDWGDKIVYVLDRMMEAIDKWSSGSGGEQLGKVFTKLAEIGMKAWLTAVTGMFKASINSALNGNLTSAVGLAMGANMLGGGSLISGGFKMAKSAHGMLSGGASVAGAEAAGMAVEGAGLGTKVAQATQSPLAGIMKRAGALTEGASLGTSLTQAAKSPLAGVLKRVAMPLGIAMDAYGVANAKPEERVESAGGMVGRWGGAWAGGKGGAVAGAALGSVVPVLGTAAGGIAGGILGSIGGFFAGDKIGKYLGAAVSKLDFSAMKIKLMAAKDEMSAAIGDWFERLPEKVGYAVGYSVTWLADLPGRGSAYFRQLVDEAEVSISTMPGRLSAWWQQTYSDAVLWATQTVSDTSNWFFSLPGLAETAWQSVWQGVDTWASNTYSSVVNWFSNIPNVVGQAFDDAIAMVKEKSSGILGKFNVGFAGGSAAAQPKAYANGGIVNQPHFGVVGEAGAEAIIPLTNRSRGMELWLQAGEMLGVGMHASGGIFGKRTGVFGSRNRQDAALLGTATSGSIAAESVAQNNDLGMGDGFKVIRETYQRAQEILNFKGKSMMLGTEGALRELSMIPNAGENMFKFAGKKLLTSGPLALAGGAANVFGAEDKTSALSGGMGAAGAGLAGAEAGAMIGTAIAPGIGTILGTIMGGLAGTIAGNWGGEQLAAMLPQDIHEKLNAGLTAITEPIESGFANAKGLVVTWVDNLVLSGQNLFNVLADGINSGIAKVQSIASSIWDNVSGFFGNKSSSMPGHAEGGIFSSPHVALFAEDGAESVIPLGSSRRSKALQIWEETGRALGVNMYADGGFTGGAEVSDQEVDLGFSGMISQIFSSKSSQIQTPSPAPVVASSNGGFQLSTGDVNIMLNSGMNDQEMILAIGQQFLAKIKSAMENQG